MAEFEIIAETNDISKARILITALQAHGFHPLEGQEAGLPGMPGIRGARGLIVVEVPLAEAEDARLLANALLKDMQE